MSLFFSSEVYPALYAYGRSLAEGENASNKYEPVLSSEQLETLALVHLEQVAYDLMHSLCCFDTKRNGVDGCRIGYLTYRRRY